MGGLLQARQRQQLLLTFFLFYNFEFIGRSIAMNVLKPHVSLNVSNIDKSVAFYEKAFGMSEIARPVN